MKQEKKSYTIKVNGNRICLTMKNKGADGIYHSATCENPLVMYEQDADGNLVIARKTRKQTIEYLYSLVAPYYADGKNK